MHKDDTRSELIALLFQDPEVGQALLIYGKNSYKEMNTDKIARQRALSRINPLAKLRDGEYSVPTLLVHGDKDEIAPFVGAERFSVELQKRGIPGGLLRVRDTKHLFDLRLSGKEALWQDVIIPAYDFLLQHLKT
jgi:dipeptidyl aminopeptidase/acylaminoacyl peptidase